MFGCFNFSKIKNSSELFLYFSFRFEPQDTSNSTKIKFSEVYLCIFILLKSLLCGAVHTQNENNNLVIATSSSQVKRKLFYLNNYNHNKPILTQSINYGMREARRRVKLIIRDIVFLMSCVHDCFAHHQYTNSKANYCDNA